MEFKKVWVGKYCNSKYKLNENDEIVDYLEGSQKVVYDNTFGSGVLKETFIRDKFTDMFVTKLEFKVSNEFSGSYTQMSMIVENKEGLYFLIGKEACVSMKGGSYNQEIPCIFTSTSGVTNFHLIDNITNFLTEEQLGIVNKKVEEEVKPVVELKKEVVKETKTEEIKQEVIQPIQKVKKQSFVVSNKVRKQLPLLVIEQLTKLDNTQQLLFEQEFKKKAKSLVVAYLCCFLLGFHYIYLKKNATQFLFWVTAGGCGFWTIYDLIRMSKLVKDYNEDVAIDIITTVKVLS